MRDQQCQHLRRTDHQQARGTVAEPHAETPPQLEQQLMVLAGLDRADANKIRRLGRRSRRHGGQIETERGDRDDHEQSLKTLQLDHQDRGHHEEHQGDDGRDRSLRFCAFFHRASDFEAITNRQRALKLVHASAELLHDRGRLRWAEDVSPHGDGGKPVPSPDDGWLEFVVQVRDGGEWDGLPVAGHELQVLQGLDRAAFRVACRGEDFHQIDVITDLGDSGAAYDAVQRLCNGLGSDAELPSLVLQHLQLHNARRLHPVKADILEQWMGADFRRQLLGEFLHLRNVGAADAVPSNKMP